VPARCRAWLLEVEFINENGGGPVSAVVSAKNKNSVFRYEFQSAEGLASLRSRRSTVGPSLFVETTEPHFGRTNQS
jgi:hypothetical protein